MWVGRGGAEGPQPRAPGWGRAGMGLGDCPLVALGTRGQRRTTACEEEHLSLCESQVTGKAWGGGSTGGRETGGEEVQGRETGRERGREKGREKGRERRGGGDKGRETGGEREGESERGRERGRERE